MDDKHTGITVEDFLASGKLFVDGDVIWNKMSNFLAVNDIDSANKSRDNDAEWFVVKAAALDKKPDVLDKWVDAASKSLDELAETVASTKSATDYLDECTAVQKQRAEQYDKSGTGERSFAATATAFNAITGSDLKGSDICLMLQILKDVRQYSDPTRLHEDSVLDKVSYSSLHAEELNKELAK